MCKRKSIAIFSVLIIFIVLLGMVGCASNEEDFEGGYYAILAPKDGETVSPEEMDAVTETLRSRLNNLGWSKVRIIKSDNGLRVEIPAIYDPNGVINLIDNQGELQFRDSKGNVRVRGEHIKDATAGINPQTGDNAVFIEFTPEGEKLFADATKAIAAKEDGVENKFSIYLGDRLIFSPTVESEIKRGGAIISPIEDAETARVIASIIKSGSLKIALNIRELKQIDSKHNNNG